MRERKVAKVTISLPQGLLDLADRLAKERSISRSGIIAELLEKEEQTRIQVLMEEGYREMAKENRRLAEEAFPLVSALLQRDARWRERADG
jgi:metal-responsive CopG/Arc/MetJ family transcriptional regulator